MPNSGTPNCRTLLKHCYIIPATQQSYFYRCVNSLDVNTSTVAKCTFPAGLAASDSGCIQKETAVLTTTTQSAQSDPLQEQMSSLAAIFNRYYGDLVASYFAVFIIGLGLAFVLGFVWIAFLKCAAGCVVWFSLCMVEVLLIAITITLYTKAGLVSINDFVSVASGLGLGNTVNNSLHSVKSELPTWVSSTSASYASAYTYTAYAFTVLCVIFLLVCIALARRVAIAIEVIKEASRAVSAMPGMAFYPFFSFLFIIGMALYFFIIAAFLHSASSLDGTFLAKYANFSTTTTGGAGLLANVTVPGVNASEVAALNNLLTSSKISIMEWLQIYHFFGFLWTNQFVSGIGLMTIAGAVCSWYWTADKKKMERLPVLGSLKRALRYHSGTIAFGALLVTIVQFLRCVLAYLDHQSKEMQERNVLVKVLFKCVACCLWCFEKCLKLINRNAYIIAAMLGCNFCSSAGKALKFLALNIAQVSTMNFLAMIMLFLGKVLITASCAIMCYIVLLYFPAYSLQDGTNLTEVWFPTIICSILSYFTASAFLEVYSMTIDTVVLCFCMDREQNDGSPDRPYYMGDGLRKYVAGGSKQSSPGVGGGGPITEEKAADVELPTSA